MSKLKLFIGSNIRQARESKGLTQLALADLIERDRDTVSNYERGDIFPSFETLEKIAEVLDRPLSFFVAGAEDMTAEARNRMAREIAGRDLLQRLDEPGLRIALETLNSLVENGHGDS